LSDGKDGKAAVGRGPGIELKPWDPKTPYLAELKRVGPQRAYATYLELRKEYGASPAYFLDCGEFFLKAGEKALALRVLSNIVELELENAPLLRVLAHKLSQAGELELARTLFEEALRLRPEEPQSTRDLALVLADLKQYPRAAELLVKVVMGAWDGRFPEIELIALDELNAMLPKAKAAGVDVDALGIDKRLVRLLDVDVRIILTWDADATDMDLWVIEPSGEKAFYGHRGTTIGGNVSCDFTGGYGPEEYMVRKAMAGKYQIKANYYGSRAAQLIGSVTLQVDVFTNYGRPNEERKRLTIRLTEQKEVIDVGEIAF
jgi:tetratricopeptide (TPR) repeat protein